MAAHLQKLSASVASGSILTDGAETVTVDALGRYQFQRQSIPRSTPRNLRVAFRTVHGSKGLEADYIVVLGMATGTYGFPSAITDDPVLNLAMPDPDTFPHAEERRLLYVALTRARHGVTLICSTNQPSPFVTELLEDKRVIATGDGGRRVEVCPECRRGTLVERTGRYGPFAGCSKFPACTFTRRLT